MTNDKINALKIHHFFRLTGLMVVLAANAFVIYSGMDIKCSVQLTQVEKFLQHANDEHQVNTSPFTITFNFRTGPLHFMDMAPSVLFTTQQFMPLIIWLTSFLIFLSWKIFFFRGEEIYLSECGRGVIIPPPK